MQWRTWFVFSIAARWVRILWMCLWQNALPNERVLGDFMVHNNPPIQTLNTFGFSAMHAMRTRILRKHWVQQLVPLATHNTMWFLVCWLRLALKYDYTRVNELLHCVNQGAKFDYVPVQNVPKIARNPCIFGSKNFCPLYHWGLLSVIPQLLFCITEIPECIIVYRSCSTVTIPLPQWRQPKSGCILSRSFRAFYLKPFFSTSQSAIHVEFFRLAIFLHLFSTSNRGLCGVLLEFF